MLTGWMSWEQIEPFKRQIVDLEYDVMKTWHYPDRDIPRSYPEQKVAELRQHLADGNTYFWGVVCHEKLLAYCWGYTSVSMGRLCWNVRSYMVLPEARGLGLGSLMRKEEENKARVVGCVEMRTAYAPFNTMPRRMLEKRGWKVTGIEVVKKIKD